MAGSAMGVSSALTKGAKVNYYHKPEDQKTSLHVAAEMGSFDVCAALLEAGALVNSISITNKDSPLILASSYGHKNVVDLLLKNGAEISCQNAYGNSSLHEATRHGFLDVTKTLIDGGADIALLNNKGSTALHLICYGDDRKEYPLEIVKLLLQQSSSCKNEMINLQCTRGFTPLLAACSVGRDDIIQCLLDNGANGKLVDSSGMDGLDIAVFHKKEKAIPASMHKLITKEAPKSVFAM